MCDCGKDGGGVSLKACKSCMLVRYCNADCQKNHWAEHKRDCKRRVAELRDAALFKDPPVKKDCPICFIPMPTRLISCVSLSNATVSSVPIYDFAVANVEAELLLLLLLRTGEVIAIFSPPAPVVNSPTDRTGAVIAIFSLQLDDDD